MDLHFSEQLGTKSHVPRCVPLAGLEVYFVGVAKHQSEVGASGDKRCYDFAQHWNLNLIFDVDGYVEVVAFELCHLQVVVFKEEVVLPVGIKHRCVKA